MQTHRTFATNEIQVGSDRFLMDSVIDPWGEDDQVVHQIIEKEFDERQSLTIWQTVASRSNASDIFLDVGAYTGIYGLTVAALQKGIRTVSFEPSTITFGRLARNIILNNFDTTILPVNLAAGAEAGQIVFPHKYGLYALCSGESSASEEFDHSQMASLVPLDALLTPTRQYPFLDSKSMSIWPYTRVQAIKIDVEGAEQMVLSGALQLLSAQKPLIIAEFLNDSAYRELEIFALENDYRLKKIGEERNVVMWHRSRKDLEQCIEASIAKPLSVTGHRMSTMILKAR